MTNTTKILENKGRMTEFSHQSMSGGLDRTSEAIDILIAEGGENFYNYVDFLGLAKYPNLVVLSSLHHYFYFAEELNHTNTVINLKELNQVKRIRSLFRSCLNSMPKKSNFIGCFVDNEKINGYVLKPGSSFRAKRKSFEDIENSIVSPFPFINMLYSLMDSKTYTYLSKRSVSYLLEEYGFKVKDMTDLNGLTFFYSQKIKEKNN